MNSRPLVTFASIAALCVVALAGNLNSVSVSEPTNFSRQLLFTGYDSANGPLESVGLCLRWKHKRKIRGESSDAQSSFVTTSFSPAVVTLELGGNTLATLNFAPLQRLHNPTAFDGIIDFQGSSSFRTKTVSHGNQLIIFDDPAILAAFIDVPSVTITIRGRDIFALTGPGNLRSESSTTFRLEGFVLYNGV